MWNRPDIRSSHEVISDGEVIHGGGAIHGDFREFGDFLRDTYYLSLAQIININHIPPISITSGQTNTQNQVKGDIYVP